MTFGPNIGLYYASEMQKAYTDSLDNIIPATTISSGELRFGPSFSAQIALDGGAMLIPKAGLSAIYTINATTTDTAQRLTFNQGDLRTKLDFGLNLTTAQGTTLSTDFFFDGIGVANYDAWGAQIKISVPLQ